MKVETRVFLGVGAFVVVVAAVYWFLSSEDAGSIMLLLAGGLGLMVGAFLLVQDRRGGVPVVSGEQPRGDPTASEADDLYLPHASVWPFALGVAALVMANGIALGLWALVPGGLLAIGSLYGWARQSSRRS